jgi:glycosyltransferase involved in cell wall biosynthesis
MTQLSILMPVYNADKYLKQAIESILNQTFRDFELIISDDGSKDHSKDIIAFFNDPRIKTDHNVTNQGKTATINRIYKSASGEFVTIHDADDFSDLHRFEKQIDFLRQNTEYGFCGTGFYSLTADGDIFDKQLMRSSYADIITYLPETSQFHGPTVVFRKSYSDNLNEIYRSYFQDNYEDIDFIYRLLTQVKGHNLNEFLYHYRVLPDSLCRKNVTIKNRNLYKVVLHLTQQRFELGFDDLQLTRDNLVDEYFTSITEKYKIDPSLIHREAAAYYMYWKFYRKAIKEAFIGITKRPISFVNYRTLQYCIRKSFL